MHLRSPFLTARAMSVLNCTQEDLHSLKVLNASGSSTTDMTDEQPPFAGLAPRSQRLRDCSCERLCSRMRSILKVLSDSDGDSQRCVTISSQGGGGWLARPPIESPGVAETPAASKTHAKRRVVARSSTSRL